ncbi:MAG: hypothetical protein R2698_06745 [Microthrixaceae bacterium]
MDELDRLVSAGAPVESLSDLRPARSGVRRTRGTGSAEQSSETADAAASSGATAGSDGTVEPDLTDEPAEDDVAGAGPAVADQPADAVVSTDAADPVPSAPTPSGSGLDEVGGPRDDELEEIEAAEQRHGAVDGGDADGQDAVDGGDADGQDAVDRDTASVEVDATATVTADDSGEVGSRLRLVSSHDGSPNPVGLDALVDDDEGPDGEPEAIAGDTTANLFALLRASQEHDDEDDEDLDEDDEFDPDESPVTHRGRASLRPVGPSSEDGDPQPSTGDAVVIDLASAAVGTGSDSADALDRDDGDDLDEQQMLLDRRDTLLEPLADTLARRVRRVVTDQENAVLDLVRRSRKSIAAADVVPDVDAQVDTYRDALGDHVERIVAAGAEFVGDDAAAPDTETVGQVVAEVFERLVTWVVEPMHTRMVELVDGSGDQPVDQAELADRLRIAYREWRSDKANEASGDLATLAFSRGVMAGSPRGARLVWIVDDGGLPCPDGEDNQLAGPVVAGEEYPTGHRCPPAHAGCRCLLVPASLVGNP